MLFLATLCSCWLAVPEAWQHLAAGPVCLRDVSCLCCLQGFDEYMNLVLDEAEEVSVKHKARKPLGEPLSSSAEPLSSDADPPWPCLKSGILATWLARVPALAAQICLWSADMLLRRSSMSALRCRLDMLQGLVMLLFGAVCTSHTTSCSYMLVRSILQAASC